MERIKKKNLLLILTVIISVIFIKTNIIKAEKEILLYNLNSEVIAELSHSDSSEDIIKISGAGKIDQDKWRGMMEYFDKRSKDNLYISWDIDKTRNTSFIIENDSIQLPDDSQHLFDGYSGNLKFPKSLDLSNVTKMSGMFYRSDIKNLDISNWDVSNVKDMSGMFSCTISTNPDVSNWDVRNVENMAGMFFESVKANPDVSNWNVDKVKYMQRMFCDSKRANPDVSNWNVDNVVDMAEMFCNSVLANPDVSNWNVGSVTNMSGMFKGARIANPNVSNWDVRKVVYMNDMFNGAISANPDVKNWKFDDLKSMIDMFANTKVANPDVSNWNVENIEYMDGIFSEASGIKRLDLSNWVTSSLAVNYSITSNKYYATDLGLDTLELDYFSIKRFPGSDNIDKNLAKIHTNGFKAPKFSSDYLVKKFNTSGEEVSSKLVPQKEKYDFKNNTHYIIEAINKKPKENENKKPKENENKKTDKENLIKPNNQSEAEIKNKIDKLYIKGYNDGTFRPNGNMTRGEVATVFSRLLADKVEFNKVDTEYPDVKSDHWASGAVKYLSDKGIVKGNTDGKFYPDNNITRAEYATIIANMKKLTAKNTDYFIDIDNHWGKDNINAAAEARIVNGYGDKIFKPDNFVLRSEAVKMTNKAFDRAGDRSFIDANLKEEGKFPDVEISHWAYTDIYEASTTHEFERNSDNSEKWIKIIEMGRVLGMK